MHARDLGYIALSTALLAISAWVAIPLGGIPITLQTLVLCLLAGLLGGKRAALSVVAYVLLGSVGAPVFAGFSGGLGVLLSPTGGYLVGFLPFVLLVGFTADATANVSSWKGKFLLLAAAGLGLLLCYAIGTVWFVLVTAQESAKIGFLAALTTCVLPYLPIDAVKIILAVFLIGKLRKYVKQDKQSEQR